MEHALDTPQHLEVPFYEEATGSCPPPAYATYITDMRGYARGVWSPAGLAPLRQTGAEYRVIIHDADGLMDVNRFRIHEDYFPKVITEPAADASPWTTQIQALRQALGLPITALVEALNVTRPAFYDWLRGEQPNRSNQQRIRALLEVADAWSKLGVGPMSRYWNIPAPGGGADLRSTLIDPRLSLHGFNALVAKLGIGERLLPPRASKPLLVERAARDPKRRSRRKAWGTTPSDAE